MTNTTTIADLDWTKDACCEENMIAHRAWVAAEQKAKTVAPVKMTRPAVTPSWLDDFAAAASIAAPAQVSSAKQRRMGAESARMGRILRANRNRL